MKNLPIKPTLVMKEKEAIENKVLVKTQVAELGKASVLTFGLNGTKGENGKFYRPK